MNTLNSQNDAGYKHRVAAGKYVKYFGRSVGGGAPFIPLKAARCSEAKEVRLPSYESTWITERAS